MTYNSELEFEKEVIKKLQEYGWDGGLFKNWNSKQIIDNFIEILHNNNSAPNKLGERRLSEDEVRRIIDIIKKEDTPYKFNKFLLNGNIIFRRDPDENGESKEIDLYIFNKNVNGGAKNIYQIIKQPRFNCLRDRNRRGDITLLINGMPLIHIELKNIGNGVISGFSQIKQYHSEGVFDEGLMSCVQLFVSMQPENAKYFANARSRSEYEQDYSKFSSEFCFNWTDDKNNKITDWKDFIKEFLAIPQAHLIISKFTIADAGDKTLKVLRSYQYHAVKKIEEKLEDSIISNTFEGGYIYHATGSGKTMTSWKAAEHIYDWIFEKNNLNGNYPLDKVIFLFDRIQLGHQSILEYRNFSDNSNKNIQDSTSTKELYNKIISRKAEDRIIKTSIQMIYRLISNEFYQEKLLKIADRRNVFIIDECHRSVFGEMFNSLRNMFSKSIWFGFTGTPIYAQNAKKAVFDKEFGNTTKQIFGDELHTYSIKQALDDKSILPVDPSIAKTVEYSFAKKRYARSKVFLDLNPDLNENEYLANASEKQKEEYANYLKKLQSLDDIKFEEKIDNSEKWFGKKHRIKVVNEILDNNNKLTSDKKFHSILATNSIVEAIDYFRLFEELSKDLPEDKKLKITAIFDPNVDNFYNVGQVIYEKDQFRKQAMDEIIEKYNNNFNTNWQPFEWDEYKKDVALRLAHKESYSYIDKTPEAVLDLVIVVDQMLTGFDSKWVSCLYLDKVLEYESLIQAISRTNRVHNEHGVKPHGSVVYYRKVATMKKNIDEAYRLFCEGNTDQIFVPNIKENIDKMNEAFRDICDIFIKDKKTNFEEKLEDPETCVEYIQKYYKLMSRFVSAKRQGFDWENVKELPSSNDQLYIEFDDFISYDDESEENKPNKKSVILIEEGLNQETFKFLKSRYEDAIAICKTYVDDIEKIIMQKSDDLPDDYYQQDGWISQEKSQIINNDYIEKLLKDYLNDGDEDKYKKGSKILSQANRLEMEKVRLDLKNNPTARERIKNSDGSGYEYSAYSEEIKKRYRDSKVINYLNSIGIDVNKDLDNCEYIISTIEDIYYQLKKTSKNREIASKIEELAEFYINDSEYDIFDKEKFCEYINKKNPENHISPNEWLWTELVDELYNWLISVELDY
ncbi:type I restriction enzyme subunit R domain-containing protein [Mycoplasma bradburyae]|uniref:type I restriction enzyme subunit R domain-containing protein n=1 Tax=Mycoplasma bradburyae TaxID=2963128 RepID=UPI0023403385|nr:DEAD/DEAH box helicase family protein [Mycoplasma bradburyae]MDC4184200.1 DEAD/DEAH box helicase family protein [Mycoplasma bradburyae]